MELLFYKHPKVEGSSGDTQFTDVGGTPTFENIEDTNFINFYPRTGNVNYL